MKRGGQAGQDTSHDWSAQKRISHQRKIQGWRLSEAAVEGVWERPATTDGNVWHERSTTQRAKVWHWEGSECVYAAEKREMARLKMRVVEGGASRMGMTNERAEMPRGRYLGGDPVFSSNCLLMYKCKCLKAPVLN